jgi:hypothetical protein
MRRWIIADLRTAASSRPADDSAQPPADENQDPRVRT